ncbi:MAG: AI-2E family transporter [Chitinispirillaceae bacterium]
MKKSRKENHKDIERENASHSEPDSAESSQQSAQKPEPEKNENTKPSSKSIDSQKIQDRVSRYVLIGLLGLVTLALIPIMRDFLVPLVLAATFVTLFYPFYKSILKRFRGNKGLSSLVCCLVLLLGLMVPAYLMAHLVVGQAIDFYEIAQPQIKDLLSEGRDSWILQQISQLPFAQYLQLDTVDWQSMIQETAKAGASLGTQVINRTSVGVFGFVANFFIILFTMFYFFMDGESLIMRLKYLSPLRNEHEEMIFSRFLLISRATVKGTLVIGLIQGTFGALALLIFGVKTWLLWGFVMVILSVIPMVGAWLVLIPAGIIQIILGDTWQGIGIILVSTVIVSNVDNLIRPRLVGRGAKMHDLMIFFSTLGGIGVFGIMGFIVGPAIAALFLTVLDIYGEEFQAHLTSMEEKPVPQGDEQPEEAQYCSVE